MEQQKKKINTPQTERKVNESKKKYLKTRGIEHFETYKRKRTIVINAINIKKQEAQLENKMTINCRENQIVVYKQIVYETNKKTKRQCVENMLRE